MSWVIRPLWRNANRLGFNRSRKYRPIFVRPDWLDSTSCGEVSDGRQGATTCVFSFVGKLNVTRGLGLATLVLTPHLASGIAKRSNRTVNTTLRIEGLRFQVLKSTIKYLEHGRSVIVNAIFSKRARREPFFRPASELRLRTYVVESRTSCRKSCALGRYRALQRGTGCLPIVRGSDSSRLIHDNSQRHTWSKRDSAYAPFIMLVLIGRDVSPLAVRRCG